MKPWRSRFALLAGAAAIAIAIPAFSQEAPESLLPPGFGEPAPPTPPAPQEPGATPAPGTPPAPAPGTAPPPLEGDQPPLETTVIENAAAEDLEALEALEPPPPIEIPDYARRDPFVVGPLTEESGGLGSGAFAGANGRFLSTLMRRLDAPLPSRWTSILLRRALLSRAAAPARVNPVDWVAERAWLLVRMGEADAARMLVQSVDVDRFTPKMFAVAVQTALATADPAGLCPLVGPGRATSDEPVWPLAEAMCASLESESGRASALIDQARRRSRLSPIDVSLAEKIVGAGLNTRRAVTIEWDGVDRLNSWRFGLAAATGLDIPGALLRDAGPHVRAWEARASMVPIEQRLDDAHVAAALGVFSNAALVDMYSLIGDGIDPNDFAESDSGRLRAAYLARRVGDRVAAIRALWNGGEGPLERYGRSVLTAGAAAQLPPSQTLAERAPELLASMLASGFDRQASRWAAVAGAMDGEQGDRAWALVALASAQPAVDLSAGRIGTFADNDSSADNHRARLLLAGLAGLGRVQGEDLTDLAGRLQLRLAAGDRWSRLIDRAGETGQGGTVALLAGIGMQTGDWRGVPPHYLYRIVRSLKAVGLDYEARMIAAEALARA
jgi:hypothetical protein